MGGLRERLTERFDSWADEYDHAMQRACYFSPEWISRHVYDLDGVGDCRVLDLACGTGLNIKLLRGLRADIHAVGIDVSPKMLEHAKAADIYESLYLLDLNNPFPSVPTGAFQLVIAFGFLEMVTDPGICLFECARVLEPGGTLWSSFRLFEDGGEYSPPRHETIFGIQVTGRSADEIGVLMGNCGMHITSIDTVVGYTTDTGFPCPFYVVSALKRSDFVHQKS